MKSPNSKRILLIDHQYYRREISAHALKSVGFIVCTLDTYNYLLPQDCLKGEDPDLVVLGCVRIGGQEQRLIAQILARSFHAADLRYRYANARIILKIRKEVSLMRSGV